MSRESGHGDVRTLPMPGCGHVAIHDRAGRFVLIGRADLDGLVELLGRDATYMRRAPGAPKRAEEPTPMTMTAPDYIRRELDAGRLTAAHLEQLVRAWQEAEGLEVDGRPGPATRAALEQAIASRAPGLVCWPLPPLDDGRRPCVTSGYRTSDRPGHDGVDLFYPYLDSDPPMPAGDGGAVVRRGDRRWWIPPGTYARAAAPGLVIQAGRIGTGLRCWVDHGNGIRTGYFHLSTLLVTDGDVVEAGAELGRVGDNPAAHDATHLHFEVSPVGCYAPVDPAPFLARLPPA